MSGTSGRRWVTVVLAASVVALAGPVPAASAHTQLTSSNPAADSTMAAPPTTVELVFAGTVRSAEPKIAVTIDGYDPVEVPAVIDGTTVTAQLDGVDIPGLTEASYPVSWRLGFRLTAADGDPFSGLLDFTVETGPPGSPSPGADASVGDPPAGETVTAGPAPTSTPLLAGIVAGAVVVGTGAATGVVLAVRRRRAVNT